MNTTNISLGNLAILNEIKLGVVGVLDGGAHDCSENEDINRVIIDTVSTTET
jgi:hypothetical protein